MNFSITNIKPIQKNTLRAFFTVSIGPIDIRGWSYHTKDGSQWVSPPSREYVDKESGEKKYSPIVIFPEKDRYYAFQEWAKEQIELNMPIENSGSMDVSGDDIPF